MLSRYQMARGVPASKLPKGIRQDARMHTHHLVRPPKDAVEAFLAEPSDAAFKVFARTYRTELEKRFRQDRSAFDALADLARSEDVFLGCSCPTKKNPDVRHCHTWLALEFFRDHYPDLDVRLPRPLKAKGA